MEVSPEEANDKMKLIRRKSCYSAWKSYSRWQNGENEPAFCFSVSWHNHWCFSKTSIFKNGSTLRTFFEHARSWSIGATSTRFTDWGSWAGHHSFD